MSNNTARHLYLLVSNTTEPERAKEPAPISRPSAIGLVSAVLVSLALWAGLFWLGGQIFAAFNR